jgi:cbb3-type cytochrome oxidase maturation protein
MLETCTRLYTEQSIGFDCEVDGCIQEYGPRHSSLLCGVVVVQRRHRHARGHWLDSSVDRSLVHALEWNHSLDHGHAGSHLSQGEDIRMSVLYIALPLAIFLGAAGLFACWYCIRSGQYDDLDSPSMRILIDDVEDTNRKADPSD